MKLTKEELELVKRLVSDVATFVPTHLVKFYPDENPKIFITNVANIISKKNEYSLLDFMHENDKIEALYEDAEADKDYSELFDYIKSHGIAIELVENETMQMIDRLNHSAMIDLKIAKSIKATADKEGYKITVESILRNDFGWIHISEIDTEVFSGIMFKNLVKV